MPATSSTARLLVLLALRAVERPTSCGWRRSASFSGLAFWETEQIVPVALPVIGWTIWRRPRVLRARVGGVGAAAIGALPWLVWNARHGWASLNQLPGGSTYWHRIRVFVSPLVPMMTGVRVPYLAGVDRRAGRARRPALPRAPRAVRDRGGEGVPAAPARRTRRSSTSSPSSSARSTQSHHPPSSPGSRGT